MNPYQPTPFVKLKHPEWSKNTTIYQVNTRQHTPEGTLRVAEKQLPRLKELGVDILWLMPVHPIGEKNRKGTPRTARTPSKIITASILNLARWTI